MHNTKFILFTQFILFLFYFSHAEDFLNKPPASRSISMGETGYILSDDESALYYNPAGLGLKNERWNGGALTFSQAEILEFSHQDFFSAVYQCSRFDRLGFSGTIINEHNPSISSTDAAGNLLGFIESGDLSTILGGGYRLFSKSNIASSVGLSVKYFFQKKFNVTEHDILFDAGYLFQLYNNFRIGIVLKNFGTTMDYISIVPGISYKQSFDTDRLHLLEISAESSILLYFKKPSLLSFGNYLYYNRFQNGVELVLLRSVMFQLGYTLGFNVNSDRWGNDLYQTTEPKYVTTHSLPFGFGISLFNHFDFNYCFKNSFSFSVKRILTWKKSDLHWWRNIKE